VNVEQALLRLGRTTSEAVVEALHALLGEGVVESGPIAIVPEDEVPLGRLPLPAVAADVSYVDGVTGGNVIALPLAGARLLAAAIIGGQGAGDDVRPLAQAELAAVGEAVNRIMSVAAMATSAFLGQEVEIAPARTAALASARDAEEACRPAPYMVSASFRLFGVPCTLVQLVPHAFVVRVTRALDEITEQHEGDPLGHALRDIPVRLWAELGRARMPMARFVALPSGEVVELDREAEDPIDLYVDGMHLGTGRLLVTEEGGLAIRIEALAGDLGDPGRCGTPRRGEEGAVVTTVAAG
jgi:flagellar motor switch protein FliN/FliY